MGTRGLRRGALASALAIVSVRGILSPAAAAPRDNYPPWDEAEAARGDQAATGEPSQSTGWY